MTRGTKPWRICVDTGGTFTDCIATSPAGEPLRVKVLSSSSLRGTISGIVSPRRLSVSQRWNAPNDFVKGCRIRPLGFDGAGILINGFKSDEGIIELSEDIPDMFTEGGVFEVQSGEEAPVLAARLVTGTAYGTPLPPVEMRLATTRGTNALLEGKGFAPALFITKGFKDLLEIGTQARPELFALNIEKPNQLYADVVEVEERLDARGDVLTTLSLDGLAERCDELLRRGVTVAAVAFMHSYLNPLHEHSMRDWLLQRGFERVSCSGDLSPVIRLLPRAQTAVTDAYLGPVIEQYLGNVRQQAGQESLRRLHVMTSAGGLQSPDRYHAKDSLLSGPAGGVVGSSTTARESGFERAIAFDMGGTSTDVSRFDGDYVYVFEHRVGNAQLLAPALAIETVAAGGGSICGYRNGQLFVGPESAGADPGPACYGAGGPLTVTDVNLLLGRVYDQEFEIPIDRSVAESCVDDLLKEVQHRTGMPMERHRLLEGFLQLANERMADAINRISVSEGCDPTEYALVSFGGAGGQHACAIATLLGIRTIIVPGAASLLSAYGLMNALIERFAERQILKPLSDIKPELFDIMHSLEKEARDALQQEGLIASEIHVRRRIANLRLLGQDSVLSIEIEDAASLETCFRHRFMELFGYFPEGKTVEIESLRVVVSEKAQPMPCGDKAVETEEARATRSHRAIIAGTERELPVHLRADLRIGAHAQGPCLYADRHTSVFVESGWSFQLNNAGSLILKAGHSDS